MQKSRSHSGSSFIPHAPNTDRSPRRSFPRSAGVHFQDFIHTIDLSRLCDRHGKGDGAREFTYHRPDKRPGMVSAMEGPMNCWGREPRLAEMLADPIVEAIMAADGVDPRQLLVSLRKTASKVVQLTEGRESGETS